MPPIVHVGSTPATWNAPGGTFTVTPHERAKPGDLLVLIVAFLGDPTAEVSGIDSLDLELTGWTVHSMATTAANRVGILTRTFTADLDGHAIEAIVAPAPTDGAAALLVLRGVASIPATLAATDSVTVKIHAAPSQALGSALGWYLAIWAMDAGLDVIPAAGSGYAATVIDIDDGTTWLVIGCYARELAGATGVHTANSVASISGVSASFQLESLPASDLAYALMPVGSFGLPVEGI